MGKVLRLFPQHDLNSHQVVQTFYDGINVSTKKMVDSRGPITKKNTVDGYALIEEMSNHSHQWRSDRGYGARNRIQMNQKMRWLLYPLMLMNLEGNSIA